MKKTLAILLCLALLPGCAGWAEEAAQKDETIRTLKQEAGEKDETIRKLIEEAGEKEAEILRMTEEKENPWVLSDDQLYAIRAGQPVKSEESGYTLTVQIRKEMTGEIFAKPEIRLDIPEGDAFLPESGAISDFSYEGNGTYSFTVRCEVTKDGEQTEPYTRRFSFIVERGERG